MAITAAEVNELRKRTGAGMMECKKALEAAGGDIEQAIDMMRKAGQAKADKKADRTTAEGAIVLKQTPEAVAMVEVNCETDFVGRDTHFREFAEAVAECALKNHCQDVEKLADLKLSNGDTVAEARAHLIAKLGENINVRRIAYLAIKDGIVGSYVHGGKIGVFVHIKGNDATLAKDLAMHIAASNPLVVNPSDLSKELVEREKEIYKAQAMESGKPADIIEKMLSSKLKKFMDESSLVGQMFVKDPNVKIENLLKSANTEVLGFTRFVLGEGIERKVGNFAEEVRAQASGAA